MSGSCEGLPRHLYMAAEKSVSLEASARGKEDRQLSLSFMDYTFRCASNTQNTLFVIASLKKVETTF